MCAVLRLDLGYAPSPLGSAVPHKELGFALKGFVSMFLSGEHREDGVAVPLPHLARPRRAQRSRRRPGFPGGGAPQAGEHS